MPRLMDGLCGSNECDNALPTGPGTMRFCLPEEQGMNPRPEYCGEDCAQHVRKLCYHVGTSYVRTDIDRKWHVSGGAGRNWQ